MLQDCNKTATLYSKRVEITANEYDWPDQHEQLDELSNGQKWLRRLFAIFVLLPLAAITTLAHVSLFNTENGSNVLYSDPVWFTLMGALVWLIIGFSKLGRPMFLHIYVLGHELTHVIAAWLSGGKVSLKDMRHDATGGYMITNKNTMFIALAPYFIPLWAITWLIICALLSLIPDLSVAPIAFAGLGFFWAFHFYWTVWVIPKDQPDLKENGRIFSLLIVYLSNLVLITIAMVPLMSLNLKAYAKQLIIQGDLLISRTKELIAWGISYFSQF